MCAVKTLLIHFDNIIVYSDLKILNALINVNKLNLSVKCYCPKLHTFTKLMQVKANV